MVSEHHKTTPRVLLLLLVPSMLLVCAGTVRTLPSSRPHSEVPEVVSRSCHGSRSCDGLYYKLLVTDHGPTAEGNRTI
jgi:hypothetical protein